LVIKILDCDDPMNGRESNKESEIFVNVFFMRFGFKKHNRLFRAGCVGF
jgi:hypothetical protein